MEKLPKGTKKNSQEKIAEIEKSRTISDAELLESGAEYKIGKNGEKRMVLPENLERDISADKDLELYYDVLRKHPLHLMNVKDFLDSLKFVNAHEHDGRFRFSLDELSDKILTNRKSVLELLKRRFDSDAVLSRSLKITGQNLFKDDKEVALAAMKASKNATDAGQILEYFFSPDISKDKDIRKAAGL